MIVISGLLAGSVRSLGADIVGCIVGHIIWFLMEVWPLEMSSGGGWSPLQPPQILWVLNPWVSPVAHAIPQKKPPWGPVTLYSCIFILFSLLNRSLNWVPALQCIETATNYKRHARSPRGLEEVRALVMLCGEITNNKRSAHITVLPLKVPWPCCECDWVFENLLNELDCWSAT